MHRALQIVLGVVFLTTVAVAPVWTQNTGEEAGTEAADESPFGFGVGIGLGTQSFDENGDTVVYQSAALYPVFSYGKLSLGLDLTLHYTFTGGDGNDFDVRDDDWVPAEDTGFAELYLGKIRFLQWAQAEDPLYARLGSLDDVTLGNGFIMGGYRNTNFLPGRRILGARLNLDGALFDFPYVGFESTAANLAAFDVYGGRFYLRPLAGTDTPVVSGLQVGSSLLTDRNPDYHVDKLDTADRRGTAAVYNDPDEVVIWGTDLRLPILTEPPFTLETFGDYVRQDDTNGGMLGTGGRIARVITYGAQLRYIGENFVPVYFDAAYDLYRLEKYALYETDTALVEEHLGWFASTGLSLFEDLFVLNVSMEGPFGDVENARNQLTGLVRLDRGLVPSLSLEARYRKVDVGAVEDLVAPEDSLIDTRLTYYSGPAAISLVYNLRYDPGIDDYVITSGLQSEITLR
ncbi:MAG: hypothetical protein ACLFPO_02570 [Spirochaetaceae bacterium]